MVAIAGEDFAVIAGDTRLTDGQYGINTRYAPKVWDVGDNIVITANGYSADGDTLVKRISQKIEVPPPIPLYSLFTLSWLSLCYIQNTFLPWSLKYMYLVLELFL